MASANGNGQPMAVPGGRINGHGNGSHLREMGFAGPRSPPNTNTNTTNSNSNSKSTSHVPCKFYRQGACQAGKACPFLHSDEPVTERAPCKYFTKGNCKFGHKCALAHILPNGHVVNGHHNMNMNMGRGHFGRVNIHSQDPSANSSLLTMQAHSHSHSHSHGHGHGHGHAHAPMQQPAFSPHPLPDDAYAMPKAHYDLMPTIDTTFSSHPGSTYGSPPTDAATAAAAQTGLSVMDVPLPASFDSQGISHMARYGPIASSVPAKFLAASPPLSYHADSPALRTLHDSAFADPAARHRAALGTSPPDSLEPPAAARRMLHSELAAARARPLLSSSVGARPAFKDDEWDDADMIGQFEEDLLPHSLSDLLTPQEKMRRFSRDQGDSETNSFSQPLSMSRLAASPTASDARYGSPSAVAASPSRFQSLWGKPRPMPDALESASPAASAFGHVGSPLRNSSLHPNASPSLRALNRPVSGDTSPFVSSPPRQASMSMISQQLQRTRISSREDLPSANTSSPFTSRLAPGSSIGGIGGIATPASRLAPLDRTLSSSSINRERIEEEQGLFSMEEEDDVKKPCGDGASTTSSTSTGNKRLSGLSWGSGGGRGSPGLVAGGGTISGGGGGGSARGELSAGGIAAGSGGASGQKTQTQTQTMQTGALSGLGRGGAWGV